MPLRSILLAMTAISGVTLIVASSAVAAEVKAGGALHLRDCGFLLAEAGGGQQDDLQLDDA